MCKVQNTLKKKVIDEINKRIYDISVDKTTKRGGKK